MRNDERLYSWQLVCYGSDEELEKFSNYFKKYAYIKHDKDRNENGELKKEHWHIIGSFEQRKSLSTLKSYLGNGQNILGKRLTDKLESYEYLYHKNDPDKYQYQEDQIICNDKSYFIENNDDKTLEALNMVDDLIKKVPLREMARRYGRDFMKNYQRYKDFAMEVKYEKSQEAWELKNKVHELPEEDQEDLPF